jgi:GH15 family glucan-1,4-alpha-glucosidase
VVDGRRGGKGTFNMCTFWYVECLARAGDVKQARFLFEKMLGYANHVGLFSEELGPADEQLGELSRKPSRTSLPSTRHIT